MNYWIYSDDRGGTIHKKDCANAQMRAQEGWRGPYATKGAAYDAVEALKEKAWNCGNCRPISISQLGGTEVSVGC